MSVRPAIIRCHLLRRQRYLRWLALGAAVALSGCSFDGLIVGFEDRKAQAETDRQTIFQDQAPLDGPVSLTEAAARAIKYNLDLKVKLFEEAVAQGVAENATYDMLPSLTANAGYAYRSNLGASTSRNLVTGEISDEPTTSQERHSRTMDLSLVWSVLDFGVSYVRAKQDAMREQVARQQRRKVLHSIIQQVRAAYWRALTAERLAADLKSLTTRVRKGLSAARRIEEQRLEPPVKALEYQKTLLELMRKLNGLQREVTAAKTELARLMNLPPGRRYELQPPDEKTWRIPEIPTKVPQLVDFALHHRPDLYAADYKDRISAEDTEIAFLRMLPGLELDTGVNYDSNRFLVDSLWADAGLTVTWNLLKMFSGPAAIELAETRQDLTARRRLALSMAVMSQTYVAHRQLLQAREEFKVVRELNEVDQRLYEHVMKGTQAATQSELQLIRRDAERVFSRAQRNQAFSRLKNAESRLLVSLGVDPLPSVDPDWKLSRLVSALENVSFSRPALTDLLKDGDTSDGFGLVGEDVAVSRWNVRQRDQSPSPLRDAFDDAAPVARPDWTVRKESPEKTPEPGRNVPQNSQFLAHLGSYRSERRAERAWSVLVQRHPALQSASPSVIRVDLGPKGTFHRLYAVAPEDRLREVCSALKTRDAYCRLHRRDAIKEAE